MSLKSIARNNRHNVQTLRTTPLSEISGALGDLGTLLPLMIALAQRGSISLSSTLVFSGIFNIATGVLFGVPLPVQPMKAIAADSIRRHVTPGIITAAGGYVSLSVLFLTATGLLRRLTQHIPVPVVKGIQLGAALNLISSVGPQVLSNPHLIWLGYAAAFLLIITLTQPRRRIPFALAIFLLGVILTASTPSSGHHVGFRPWIPRLSVPDWLDWEAGGMALGQLPLTTLNSIIAASALATELAPDRPVSVTALGYSVAGMNLIGCWFGAMPVCHGAGGLAAQWRFGARSGASIILLGLAKLFLGLVFGDSLMGVIDRFPGSLLGVMVLGAGLELARVAVGVNEEGIDLREEGDEGDEDGVVVMGRKKRELGDEERAERWMVLLVTMAGIVAFKNDAVGFIGGMGCFWFYRLGEWWERIRGSGELSL